MRELKNFTIKEFEQYQELLQEDVLDEAAILELFGVDINTISIDDYKELMIKITTPIPDIQIKKVYNINNRYFKPITMIKDIKAGQFIDFQNLIDKKKPEELLSIFLIPCDKPKWYKKDKEYIFKENYDIIEVQKYLFNNMKMEDVNALSVFFLTLSLKLLPRIQVYLLEEMRLKKKQIKDLKNPK